MHSVIENRIKYDVTAKRPNYQIMTQTKHDMSDMIGHKNVFVNVSILLINIKIELSF